MGRTMPVECPHGVILDWGDFGGPKSKRGRCDRCEKGHESAFTAQIRAGMEGYLDTLPTSDWTVADLDGMALHIARHIRSVNTERSRFGKRRPPQQRQIDGIPGAGA